MYFLVDYENVMEPGLNGVEYLCADDILYIYYSDVCRITRMTMEKILHSGCKFEIYKLQARHKNGLDFYIATTAGKLIGEGCTDYIALISKDTGFQAIVDYWGCFGKDKEQVFRCVNLENAMLKHNNKYGRVGQIQLSHSKLTFDEALGLSDTKMEEGIKERVGKTSYFAKANQIHTILNKPMTKRGYYLESIKAFGKKEGTAIYNLTKDMVKEEIKNE